jgi:hypothetical protein
MGCFALVTVADFEFCICKVDDSSGVYHVPWNNPFNTVILHVVAGMFSLAVHICIVEVTYVV